MTGVTGIDAVYTRVGAAPSTKIGHRGALGRNAGGSLLESRRNHPMNVFFLVAGGSLLGFLIAYLAYRSHGQVADSRHEVWSGI